MWCLVDFVADDDLDDFAFYVCLERRLGGAVKRAPGADVELGEPARQGIEGLAVGHVVD
jgi:hypothetical protein